VVDDDWFHGRCGFAVRIKECREFLRGLDYFVGKKFIVRVTYFDAGIVNAVTKFVGCWPDVDG